MEIMQIGISEEESTQYMYADLIDICSEPIYKLCRKLTYSKEDAEDLFQETFLKALEQGISNESTLITTAIYLWKSQKRKYARRSRIAPTVPLDESGQKASLENPEDSVMKREDISAVREFVDAMPEKFRIPVILHYTVEMRVADIAAAMGIPDGTVKSRPHKARKMIEKGLIKLGHEI